MNTLKQNEAIAVGVGIVLVAVFFFFPGIFSKITGTTGDAGINTSANPDAIVVEEGDKMEGTTIDTTNNTPNMTTTAEGLVINDVKVGTGAEVKNGDTVSVHYVGTFTDGSKFDSSVDRGTPFSFTVGGGQVIKGWELGLVGMKVGGERKLTIPSTLGYGAQTYGPIPGGSTLLFDIQLLKVEAGK